MSNFVSKVLESGGSITPLVIPASDKTKGTGLFNPSIYNDNGKLYLNLRHCQYTIYHSEKNKFEHHFGPLVYLNPENDMTLTTTNYFCEINDDMLIGKHTAIDTSKLDVKPIWEFVGLEDCRVVRWDDKLYVSGVRRDTTPNGQGRMELSEIQFDGDSVKEVSRFRIPAPGLDNSYCEKNWMPIVDMPYHYVKWCNPTEVVKVDPIKKTCETAFLSNNFVPKPYDFRGGSQVITVDNYRICIAHVVNLFKSVQGRKNATYRHAFIIWDKDWNVVKYTEPFDFMGAEIEFACGMTEYNGDILITFGFQDNAAYLVKFSKKFLESFINEH
jgi:hypothetical protein